MYIHKGEPTPFTLGTLVIFAFCFLILIIATFSQLHFSHPWFINLEGVGIELAVKNVQYIPQIPAMLFIIYMLGKNYSIILFILYLLIGFFVWPIFAFGGGLGYAQNYLFGYFLGFIFAIISVSFILKKSINLKNRLLGALVGVLSVHITGFIYCILLAIFKVIDFSLIMPIVNTISGTNIIYDIVFSLLLFSIIPYIKNVFWICMKPKADDRRKPRKYRHTIQNS